MRLLSRLDDERKSGAIWYVIFRQSPNMQFDFPAPISHAPETRVLRRFLSNDIPSCLSFRPSSVLRQPFHRSTMRLMSRLDDERKSGAIWYAIFRQSPDGWHHHRLRYRF
jgi:hypothetical protein